MPTDHENPPSARTRLDLMKAQLAAIEAWNAVQRAQEAAAEAGAQTRELRLDLSRRTEARRREKQALVARAQQQLRESGGLLTAPSPTRAVIAHRSPWLRDAVSTRLEALGVEVVGVFEDGADAAGTLVAEQPDLLLVEDRLPTVSGVEVVQRARDFSPETVVGAHCLDESGVRALLEAGATAAFPRRTPPVDIADRLVRALRAEEAPLAIS